MGEEACRRKKRFAAAIEDPDAGKHTNFAHSPGTRAYSNIGEGR